MTILTKRLSHLQALGLPSDAEMIRRARAFAIRSGLTLAEFAGIAGLNASSLRVFLAGHYDKNCQNDSNTLAIRAALKQLIDQHEIGNPLPSSKAHYDTAEFKAVRSSMWAALRNGSAFLVDGPPGTQKTYTFRRVAEEINRSKEGRAVYVYTRIDHTPAAFLIETCTEAGIPNRGSVDQLIRKLRFFLANQRALLIVDEAQHLGINGLEVLRQLLDTPPFFGVVLGGSHDLSVRLRDWRMEQWRSRLRRSHLLTGLTKDEAARILTGELGPMKAADIADVVRAATVQVIRNKENVRYISARNLFFAIEDALDQVKTTDASARENCA
jgi:DNA transposition AAA+ family ATPase